MIFIADLGVFGVPLVFSAGKLVIDRKVVAMVVVVVAGFVLIAFDASVTNMRTVEDVGNVFAIFIDNGNVVVVGVVSGAVMLNSEDADVDNIFLSCWPLFIYFSGCRFSL